MDIFERDAAYIAGTYGRFPVAVVKGCGSTVWDEEGREYIDFTSGIGVCSLGHCDEGYIGAVSAQLSTLDHMSNLYYTKPCVDAAELLLTKSGMKKVFFCNSGAEANEGAIKAARKYSFDKYGAGRSKIVTLVNSFHGRTVTTLSATGQEVFHNYFFPFTDGFEYACAGDMDDLLSKLPGACAVMLELIQGEGGVIPLDPGYVSAVAAECEKRDILLIIDEVQTGVGRTGAFFCYQRYGITPDIVSAAKGIGGGLPLGAVLFGEKTADTLTRGTHATTFGGNPIVCAGACAVLSRLTEEFLAGVEQKGEYLKKKLCALPHIEGVTGAGLMIGAKLEAGISAGGVVAAGIKKGVLTLTAKDKLRLLPPLTITKDEMDKGIEALAMTLEEV